LFVRALPLSEAEREHLLATEPGLDAGLREDVRALLAESRKGSSFLTAQLAAPLRAIEALADRLESGPGANLPERIGEFRVLERIGAGGMGVVYLAEQEAPRRFVALKVLRADVVSPDALKRFAREAELLARLDHPGIVRVISAGVVEENDSAIGGVERPWIAMEHVAGAELLEHATAQALGLRERVRLLERVARTVAYAHAQGIVHRDLKPSNLMVDAQGAPRVLDFGLARLADTGASALHTRSGEVLGTLSWMAPEQAAGNQARVDARADVWSLGAILYELLAGRRAFEARGRSLAECALELADRDPLPLSWSDPRLAGELEAIVGKCLEKEPAARYADAGELADDLTAWLEHRAVRARPPGSAQKLAKWVKRHRGLAAGLGAAFGALTTGLVVALLALKETRAAQRELVQESQRIQLAADHNLLPQLIERAHHLWPATSASVPALEAWVEEARDLVRRQSAHENWLAELAQSADLAVELAATAPFGSEFDRPSSARRVTAEREFLAALSAFQLEQDPRLVSESGHLPDLERRLSVARALRAETVDAHAARWSAASAAIAADPRFGGFALEPQEGLVPLGADPHSGLQEFWLADRTGPCPQRDPTTRELVLRDDLGIVLVLLPGAEFWFGAQSQEPDAPNFDLACRPHEGPPRRLALAPFFAGKYEVTQAQWIAFRGEAWCRFPAQHENGPFAPPVTLRHPVEAVSPQDALEFTHRLGLALPSEPQWEYLASGGAARAYLVSTQVSGLAGAVSAWTQWREEPALAANVTPEELTILDDYRYHAPVGTYRANGYGLHEVLGNIAEICSDAFWVDRAPYARRAGDQHLLAPLPPERLHCLRGGSYAEMPHRNRLWMRSDLAVWCRNDAAGIRVVRPLASAP
jgi:formylglycine-generating enzyme required for sulfatase activity/predicted Ser/Thr protein kinase